MTEERFTLKDNGLYDSQEDKYYPFVKRCLTTGNVFDLITLLNNQHSTIQKQEEELSLDVDERFQKALDKIEKLQRSKAYWKKQCKEWEKNWDDLAYEFARVNNMNKELSKDLED